MLKAILIIIILIVLVLILAVLAAYKNSFLIRGPKRTGYFRYFFEKYPGLTHVPFSCVSSGYDTLRGTRLIPDDDPKALIVLTNGFNRTYEFYLAIGKEFCDAGYEVLLFDGTGFGESGGRSIKGLSQHMTDMADVLDAVSEDPELSSLPLLLFGHSWGGFASDAVHCIKEYPVKGLISLAAFNDALDSTRPTLTRRYKKLAPFFYVMLKAITHLQFGKAAGYTSLEGLSKLSCPVLICHSKDDVIVRFSDSFVRIREALHDRPYFTFTELDGRNHDLMIPPDNNLAQIELMQRIRENHIDLSAPDASGDPLVRELWDLQTVTDPEFMKTFIEFFDKCIK